MNRWCARSEQFDVAELEIKSIDLAWCVEADGPSGQSRALAFERDEPGESVAAAELQEIVRVDHASERAQQARTVTARSRQNVTDRALAGPAAVANSEDDCARVRLPHAIAKRRKAVSPSHQLGGPWCGPCARLGARRAEKIGHRGVEPVSQDRAGGRGRWPLLRGRPSGRDPANRPETRWSRADPQAADVVPTHLEIAGTGLLVWGVEDDVDADLSGVVEGAGRELGEDAASMPVGVSRGVDGAHTRPFARGADEAPLHERSISHDLAIGFGHAHQRRAKGIVEVLPLEETTIRTRWIPAQRRFADRDDAVQIVRPSGASRDPGAHGCPRYGFVRAVGLAPKTPAETTRYDMMLKRVVRTLAKPLSAVVDTVRPPGHGVTVLIYHRVGGGSLGEVDLDVSVFADQMAELAESATVISLDRAVSLLSADRIDDADPPREADHVVVTFDDGTPDVVEHALPVLERHGIPMTLYLATGHVDDGVGFWDPADAPLTWAAVRELAASPLVDIGSHTHRHSLLDRLDRPQIVDELDRSIDLIGEHTGTSPRHFAYPKALAPNAAADAEVRARFASAAIAGTRPNEYGATDVHLLARSPIQRSDAMRWFRRKARGGLGTEDRLRDVLNRRRYANATR